MRRNRRSTAVEGGTLGAGVPQPHSPGVSSGTGGQWGGREGLGLTAAVSGGSTPQALGQGSQQPDLAMLHLGCS